MLPTVCFAPVCLVCKPAVKARLTIVAAVVADARVHHAFQNRVLVGDVIPHQLIQPICA
jgi:hypothetical protein